ncbi:MAG TPA: universal stress protein [Vicinamibacterales bacterium]|jgi:nucleotide-binding universal stress UspA family protein
MAPHVTRILVPTDFSEAADAALAYAKTLATKLDASLHLLHVFRDPCTAIPFVPETYAPPPPDLRERALDDAWDQLHDRLNSRQHTRFAGTRAVVEGLTAIEIVKYARDHGIDLIVMGTHGRRGVAHLFLGSVAEHVVRTAGCPVLTVREAAEPREAHGGAAKVA